MPTPHSSKIQHSRLIELFAARAAGSGSDARSALRSLLIDLRRAVKWTRQSPQIEKAQLVRGILSTAYKIGWDRDGSLEPLGTGFDKGFKLTLNAKASKNRIRFTQAHELCHTFFYQYVPEIKYRPHVEDPGEERLCNFGAAELLMPEYSLRKEIKQSPRSLQALLGLATLYCVSPEAMMSRLRSLRLWNGELYIWQRAEDGDFTLDRIVGSNWLPWKWSDTAIPTAAWVAGKHAGHTYLEFEVRPGDKRVKSFSFDARRKGNTLIALSGVSRHTHHEEKSLFDS